MRKVLIVSPHFPPVDAVDMHRVRMNVAHYPEYGWQPTVLTVRPEDSGRNVDERLCATLPEGLEIHRVGAISEKVTRPFGLSAIGLRAHRSLARAGDALLRNGEFDLVLFSTTAFPVMTLGSRWHKKYGVPFVLDFQDPWYTSPTTTPHAGNWKYRLMRTWHKLMERRVVPTAAGLIAVSRSYIDALQSIYQFRVSSPSATIPFGFSVLDFEKAKSVNGPDIVKARPDGIVCIAAGRINSSMTESLAALFRLISRIRKYDKENELLNRLSIIFYGTGYQAGGNPSVALPLASAHSLHDMVSEHPDRIPLLDAYRALMQADVLLILGSDDLSYQPSKLFPYLYLEKPVICVVPGKGVIAEKVRGLGGVIFVDSEQPLNEESSRNFKAQLDALLEDANTIDYSERKRVVQCFESRELAGKECALFDAAISNIND